MTATILAGDLTKALGTARRIAPTRSPIPILTHARVVVTDGRMTIYATDLERWIEVSVEAGGDLPDMALPIEPFLDISKFQPADGEVKIEPGKHDRVTVSCGRNRHTLAWLGADGWPDPRSDDLAPAFTMHAAELAQAVSIAAPAVATSADLHKLGGVHIDAGDGELTFVGTNKQVLIRHDVGVTPEEGFKPFTLPRDTGTALPHVLPQTEQAEVSASDNVVRIVCGNTTMTSTLIADPFPDFRRPMPQEWTSEVVVPGKALLAAIQQALATAGDIATRDVHMEVLAGSLRLTGGNPQIGESWVEIDATCDVPILTCFLASHAQTLINAVGADRDITIRIPDHPRPLMFSSAGSTSGIVMPLTPKHQTARAAA